MRGSSCDGGSGHRVDDTVAPLVLPIAPRLEREILGVGVALGGLGHASVYTLERVAALPGGAERSRRWGARTRFCGMHGMVFGAGLGTRLAPLTEALPKPAAPLMNRPLACWSLERLRAAGVTRCAVNTFHLAEEADRTIGAQVPAGLSVEFVREAKLLGTGGGMKNALRALGSTDEPILVMNGDIFFWPDLEGALALHRALGAVATMVLRPDPRAAKLGAVDIDAKGRVRRLLGTPQCSQPLRTMMFTGVHVLSPEALDDLPEEGCVVRHAYRHWIDGGAVVGGFVDHGAWRDLGTPAEYLRAHVDLLRGDLTWPGLVIPEDGVYRGAGTQTEGATLREVVLGDGAQVAPGITLERAVVWPGTRVEQSGADLVAAPHALVLT